VSQSSEFCRHKPLCCFSTSVYRCCLFRYRFGPETFRYALVLLTDLDVQLLHIQSVVDRTYHLTSRRINISSWCSKRHEFESLHTNYNEIQFPCFSLLKRGKWWKSIKMQVSLSTTFIVIHYSRIRCYIINAV
jgi:hypothetical protein